MADEKETYLKHYGTPRHSGRYPWGSGKKYQRSRNFISRYTELVRQGKSKKEIVKELGLKNTSELNARRAAAMEEKKTSDILFVTRLKEKGMSNIAIAERMGVTEGTVRNLLKASANEEAKSKSIVNVAKVIGEQTRDKTYLDVGKSTNLYLGITGTKLGDALTMLQDQGYTIIRPRLPQINNPKQLTNSKILIPPGTNPKEALAQIYKDPSIIQTLNEIHFNENGHGTVDKIHDPVSVDKNRIQIRYAEEGGREKDGVIEIRPGVKDLDLGDSRYAQVRILTNDGKSYLKGMAMYNYDMPEGVDIVFNTNKHQGTEFADVLKISKNDKHNPYGAAINRQNDWVDENGTKHEGALNIVREEGEWETWSKNLASQFLSKQPIALAKRQLTIAAEQKEAEFEAYNNLTNPTLKKYLLESFADDCDTAAVCMKGAAMPRQATKVILPLPSLSDTECYCPSLPNGEEVVLVRYPHQGRFEIPRLIVNNNSREGKEVITSSARDAIGINPKVAERLSGADFDGDTVICIPSRGQNIINDKELEGLRDFDPKERYARPKGTEPPWKKGSLTERIQMGEISNLITDMTLQDAPVEKIVRATKHALTIIDVAKHNLDYKASEEENGIDALKREFQMHPDGKYGGASTLISRAKSQERVALRDPFRYEIDEETGKKTQLLAKDQDRFYIKRSAFVPKDEEAQYKELKSKRDSAKSDAERDKYAEQMRSIPGIQAQAKATEEMNAIFSKIRAAKTDKEKEALRGQLKKMKGVAERTTTSTKMAETDDAFKLSTGLPIETVYAEYANRMKALGNAARKRALETEDLPYSSTAAKLYSNEVASLRKQLENVKKNQPLERAANRIAAANLKLVLNDNPGMEDDDIKKTKQRLLKEARQVTGAARNEITISDKEWAAIQSGAVPKSVAKEIFVAADNKTIIQKALPKNDNKMSATMITSAKRMLNGGYTLSEVANALGVSVSTIERNVDKSAKKGT